MTAHPSPRHPHPRPPVVKPARWTSGLPGLAAWLAAACVAAPSAQAYDLQEAYALARANDSQLASALSSRDAAAQRAQDARGLWTPQVDAAVGRSFSASRLTGVPGVDNGRLAFPSNTVSVSAVQPVYSRTQSLFRVEGALQSQYEDVQVRQSANELLLRTAQAWLDLVLAQVQLRCAEQERVLLDALVRLGTADPGASAATEPLALDSAATRVRQAQAEVQERVARNQLLQRQFSLRQTVGQLPSRPIGFALAVPPLGAADVPQLAQLQELARRDNLAVRLAELTLQIADAALERARAARLPSIDLVANYSVAQGLPLYAAARTSALQVGIQASIPLSGGALESGKVKESSFLRSKAAHDLESARRLAVQAGLDAYFDWQNNLLLIEAERRKAAVLAEPAAGPVDEVRRLEAAIDVLQSARELQRLRHDNALLYLRIHQAMGPLEDAHVAAVNRFFRP